MPPSCLFYRFIAVLVHTRSKKNFLLLILDLAIPLQQHSASREKLYNESLSVRQKKTPLRKNVIKRFHLGNARAVYTKEFRG